MGFTDIDLKNCYESGIDNILEDFYIPVLQEAVFYRRIAGFFSSTSLAVASKGIVGLIKNGGKMELIVCPRLSDEDVETIIDAKVNPEEYIGMEMLEDIASNSDFFVQEHLKALGYLIAKGLLEIRVAFVLKDDGKFSSIEEISNSGIFHQKVGILTDMEGNSISFSGSVNETCSGWCSNIEEFKVFKSWIPEQNIYCQDDVNKFNDFWNNNRKNVRLIDLPSCVKEKLVILSSDYNEQNLLLEKYKKRILEISSLELLSLFDYQKKAIEMWEENNHRLLLEMATGTGKTRTAIGSLWKIIEKEKRIVIVIATPQNTLSTQWKREIENLKLPVDKIIIADSTNSKWRKECELYLLALKNNLNKAIIILTTHITYSSKDFIKMVNDYSSSFTFMLIGDEAHGMAASKTRLGLIDDYKIRLGLSATPARWYDDYGTKLLYDFFGSIVFQFNIGEALSTVLPTTKQTPLVNYYYEPIRVELNEEELYEYVSLSNQINKFNFAKDEEKQKILESLLFKRANIQKNALDKYIQLELLLKSMENVLDTLIFCSSEQIDNVMNILFTLGIKAHRITEQQGTRPEIQFGQLSERDYLIKCFKEHRYQILTAIKCLDEGIDIPTANTAILMSSSTNPREYVQRIGRVIRRSPGKKYAYIYDMIVKPDVSGLPEDIQRFEKKIYEKELERALGIAQYAINKTSAVNKLLSFK